MGKLIRDVKKDIPEKRHNWAKEIGDVWVGRCIEIDPIYFDSVRGYIKSKGFKSRRRKDKKSEKMLVWVMKK